MCELLVRLVVKAGVVEVFIMPGVFRFTELETILSSIRWPQTMFFISWVVLLLLFSSLVIWLLMASFASASSRTSALLSTTLSFAFDAFNHSAFIDRRTCAVVVACELGWGLVPHMQPITGKPRREPFIWLKDLLIKWPFDIISKWGCLHNRCIGYFNSTKLFFASIEIIPRCVTFFWYFFILFFNISRTLKYRGGPGLPEKPCSRDKQVESWLCCELIVTR